MKRNVLAVSNPEVLARLDALLPLLARALKSRHSAVASLALRCLCHTVRLPLPGVLFYKTLWNRNFCNWRRHSMGALLALPCVCVTQFGSRRQVLQQPSTRSLVQCLWSSCRVKQQGC